MRKAAINVLMGIGFIIVGLLIIAENLGRVLEGDPTVNWLTWVNLCVWPVAVVFWAIILIVNLNEIGD